MPRRFATVRPGTRPRRLGLRMTEQKQGRPLMCEAHACQTGGLQVRFLPTGSSASVVALSNPDVFLSPSFLLYSREI